MIANSLRNRNRLRKYNFFLQYFEPDANIRILDVGASEKEYQEAGNILEKKYPYPECITVLGVDEYSEFQRRYPKVKTIIYDGGRFPLRDKQFGICWCSAVIEHVGDINAQIKFLSEMARVARKVFFTTPNRYFPFEVHTRLFLLHWLPKAIFDKILKKTGKTWASGNYMHLLGLKDVKTLLYRCGINKYKIIKNRIFGFVVDFMIVF